MSSTSSKKTIVIGAGPAGLSCAYRLLEHENKPLILEADPTYVGGLARTVNWKGNRFDIGGHRFFTRSDRVKKFWTSILGREFLVRPRQSRIMYQGNYLNYPLQLGDAFSKLGHIFLLKATTSYIWAQMFGPRGDRNFEEWIVRRFGRKLFNSFFKSYTEKVWGIPCSQISADWAAQRISGLSIPTLIRSILFKKSAATAKTLIDQFEYPRLGPGQLWDKVAAEISSSGGEILLDSKVCEIHKLDTSSYSITTESSSGQKHQHLADSIISTMPLRELCKSLAPKAPPQILEAASALKYRDFLVVALLLDCPSPFSDQWLYIHEPGVAVGRIQNMANWSSDLVADSNTTVLLLEYFCSDLDGLWNNTDIDLLELAKNELAKLKITPKDAQVIDGTVVRTPKAYPLYDATYVEHVNTIKEYLNQNHPNIQTVGRNGMHRYNNQDHAILTGFLAAEALIGLASSDTAWQVNQDAQYIEERLHPERISE